MGGAGPVLSRAGSRVVLSRLLHDDVEGILPGVLVVPSGSHAPGSRHARLPVGIEPDLAGVCVQAPLALDGTVLQPLPGRIVGAINPETLGALYIQVPRNGHVLAAIDRQLNATCWSCSDKMDSAGAARTARNSSTEALPRLSTSGSTTVARCTLSNWRKRAGLPSRCSDQAPFPEASVLSGRSTREVALRKAGAAFLFCASAARLFILSFAVKIITADKASIRSKRLHPIPVFDDPGGSPVKRNAWPGTSPRLGGPTPVPSRAVLTLAGRQSPKERTWPISPDLCLVSGGRGEVSMYMQRHEDPATRAPARWAARHRGTAARPEPARP